MSPDAFTKRMARFVMSSSERFAAAKSIGKWRRAKHKNVGHIAALKIACRNGGVDLDLNDWTVLCCILERDATPHLCADIWHFEKLRRAGETLRTKGKPQYFAVIDGVKIPTSLSVIAHFRRVYGKKKFPIEFIAADDNEAQS